MFWIVLFSIIAVIVAYIYFKWRQNKWDNSPPGPKRNPIFGNALQLNRLLHKTYCKWADTYGSIMRVDLGNLKSVVINDPQLVREIFSESVFSGRQDFGPFDVIGTKLHGIVNTEGDTWAELRKFTLKNLKDFGFGKKTMEDAIMIEVNELIEGLQKEKDKPVFNIKTRLLLAVVNSVWEILTGNRFSQNNPELLTMTKQKEETINKAFERGVVLVFLPFLAKVIPHWSGYAQLRKELDRWVEYFMKPIKEHEKSRVDDYDRDFVDAYLRQATNTADPKSAFYGKFGVDNLIGIMNDMYVAGTDTSSLTLSWLILYLSKMPEIQKKLQNEIETVTGNTRSVSLIDRPKMSYAEAVIAETLRFSSIIPQGVNHRAVQDAEFKGFKIPKNCLITANLYYIHHNPKIWGDPENFRPERFLSPDGKTFKKHEALMPFSIGKRQCLGESLARDSLFLFATNIFQRFSIQFDKNGPDNGFESEETLMLTPKPFQVILKDRLV